MTLSQLQYAITLSDSGSFKKASERLHISQPALSMQIQKLEDEVGLILFNRIKSPVTLTSDGKQFIDRARQVILAADSLQRFSQSLHEQFAGELKVGIIPTLAPFLVPLFAEQFQVENPQLHLDITECVTQNVIERVLSGHYDAGIISIPFILHELEVRPLFYEKFFVYTAEANFSIQKDVDLALLDYNNLWLLEEGNCFRDQVNDFCNLKKIRQHKTFIYRSNSIDALIRLVDQRGGSTILPELSTLCLSNTQEERLKPIHGQPKARQIGLLTLKHPTKPRFINKLQTSILKNIPRSLLSAKGLDVVDPAIYFKR